MSSPVPTGATMGDKRLTFVAGHCSRWKGITRQVTDPPIQHLFRLPFKSWDTTVNAQAFTVIFPLAQTKHEPGCSPPYRPQASAPPTPKEN